MNRKIIVISGERDSGKTRLMYAICSLLDLDGHSIGGMIQVPTLPAHEKSTYTISDQSTGLSQVILSQNQKEGYTPFQKFYINNDAFNWANNQIITACSSNDYIIFDEIGKLELMKDGFYPSLQYALKNYEGIIIMNIRTSFLNEILEAFSIEKNSILHITSSLSSDEAYKLVSNYE